MVAAERLPCGVPVDELLAQVAEQAPARDPLHQSGCLHCRAALAEIRSLWAPVDRLASEGVRAPSGLRAGVMAQVRRLPRNAWHAVVGGERGSTMIAARVVSTVARLAAESLPSVAFAVSRAQQASGSPVRVVAGEPVVALAGSHVVLDVRLVVLMGEHIPTVARALRGRITEQIERVVGLTVTEIDVAVVDVQPGPPVG